MYKEKNFINDKKWRHAFPLSERILALKSRPGKGWMTFHIFWVMLDKTVPGVQGYCRKAEAENSM